MSTQSSVTRRQPALPRSRTGDYARILLVAQRELRQTLRTRSFWLTVVLIPLLLLLGGAISGFVSSHEAHEKVLVVDPGGTAFPLIKELLAQEDKDIDVAAPGAGLETRALEANRNGDTAALAKAATSLVTPERTGLERVGPDRVTASGTQHYDYVIAIPPDFPQNPHVSVWASHAPGGTVLQAARTALSMQMRDDALRANGVAPPELARVNALAPSVTVTAPKRIFNEDAVTRATPAVLAYMLILVVVISAQWLLQALVEERSGKLIEALLSCVSPPELLCGKLIGALEAAIIMMVVWIGVAIASAEYVAPHLGMSLGQILAPLASWRVLLGAPFFILVGYGLLAMVFLAIGSLCETMREAQGMVMPVVILLIIPSQLFLQLQGRGYSSRLFELAHWVPIWTPFLALASIRTTPAWALIGQGVTLAAFTVFAFFILIRIFRRALLRNGQRPSWQEIVALARSEG